MVDYIPGERFTTAFPEDTWGISTMLRDFVVESRLVPRGGPETDVDSEAYCEPIGWKVRLLNPLFLRRLMARRARLTLLGSKRLAEVGTG